jgi:hypothetical protein
MQPPARDPGPGRWASVATAAATATFAGMVALLATSGPRVHSVRVDGPPRRSYLTAEAEPPTELAGGTIRRTDRFKSGTRHPSIPTVRTDIQPPRPAPAAEQWIAPTAPGSPAPRILRFGGPAAPSGRKLALRGTGLLRATRVLFLAADGTRADARFGVIDDERILATVPDLGPREQDAAVAVVAPAGVAVTIPRDATVAGRSASPAVRGRACVVPAFCALDGSTASLVFLDVGGTARPSGPGTTFFARRGARLRPGRGDPLVFCEPGVLDRSDEVPGDFVEVNAVVPCFVDTLFHYAGH